MKTRPDVVTITENIGHPWGGTAGWDFIELRADSERAIKKFRRSAKRERWVEWSIGHNGDQVTAVLYKPHGVTGPWTPPTNQQALAFGNPSKRASRMNWLMKIRNSAVAAWWQPNRELGS